MGRPNTTHRLKEIWTKTHHTHQYKHYNCTYSSSTRRSASEPHSLYTDKDNVARLYIHIYLRRQTCWPGSPFCLFLYCTFKTSGIKKKSKWETDTLIENNQAASQFLDNQKRGCCSNTKLGVVLDSNNQAKGVCGNSCGILEIND